VPGGLQPAAPAAGPLARTQQQLAPAPVQSRPGPHWRGFAVDSYPHQGSARGTRAGGVPGAPPHNPLGLRVQQAVAAVDSYPQRPGPGGPKPGGCTRRALGPLQLQVRKVRKCGKLASMRVSSRWPVRNAVRKCGISGRLVSAGVHPAHAPGHGPRTRGRARASAPVRKPVRRHDTPATTGAGWPCLHMVGTAAQTQRERDCHAAPLARAGRPLAQA
jgi:hypothetical protein